MPWCTVAPSSSPLCVSADNKTYLIYTGEIDRMEYSRVELMCLHMDYRTDRVLVT